MGESKKISVRSSFTRTPGGRYRKYGKYSGEEFREEILEPLLRKDISVIVDLDGVVGYPPSFLEEVFGGIIRSMGPDIQLKIEIRATRHPEWVRRARGYMQDAIKEYGK